MLINETKLDLFYNKYLIKIVSVLLHTIGIILRLTEAVPIAIRREGSGLYELN